MNTNVENYTLIQIPIEEADENNPFNAVALKATDVISLYQYSTDVGMKECEKILRTPFIQVREYTTPNYAILHYPSPKEKITKVIML